MSDRVAAGDTLYWRPIAPLLAWLSSIIPAAANVLEIGPGDLPFARATVLTDVVQPKNQRPDQAFVRCDLGAERLPFPDKHFDFVYCRHMLEDMADPFAVMREIERVGCAGYIETPSPLAELCRGVDGPESLPWRGYNHHYWVVWENDGELFFLTKFPVIEHIDASEIDLAGILRQGPRYWNTYHLWRDEIRFVHRRPMLHFAMPIEYPSQLTEAVRQSENSANTFWERMSRKITRAA